MAQLRIIVNLNPFARKPTHTPSAHCDPVKRFQGVGHAVDNVPQDFAALQDPPPPVSQQPRHRCIRYSAKHSHSIFPVTGAERVTYQPCHARRVSRFHLTCALVH